MAGQPPTSLAALIAFLSRPRPAPPAPPAPRTPIMGIDTPYPDGKWEWERLQPFFCLRGGELVSAVMWANGESTLIPTANLSEFGDQLGDAIEQYFERAPNKKIGKVVRWLWEDDASIDISSYVPGLTFRDDTNTADRRAAPRFTRKAWLTVQTPKDARQAEGGIVWWTNPDDEPGNYRVWRLYESPRIDGETTLTPRLKETPKKRTTFMNRTRLFSE